MGQLFESGCAVVATSALDTGAERAIQSKLERIAHGRRTLIIAHRLSTIVNAAQIIVMDKGRIVEPDSHTEPASRDGLYARLWNLQRQQRKFEQLERGVAALVVNVIQGGLQASIDTRGVRLDADIEMDGVRVVVDPSELAHVLWELGFHALAATPDGGGASICGFPCVGTNVRLCRIDGSNAAVSGNREEKRTLADPVPMDPIQHRSMIERQGGHMAVESASSLRGMRFVVHLPRHALSPEDAVQEADPTDAV